MKEGGVEERDIKETLLEYIERMISLYKVVILPATIIFALFVFFIPPIFKRPPYTFLYYFVLFLVSISFFLVFLIYLLIKRKIYELPFEKIQKILIFFYLFEISSIALSLWVFLSHTEGHSFFLLLPFLIIFFFSLPGYFSQKWLKIFVLYLISIFILFFLSGIFNFYPSPLPTSPLRYSASAWTEFIFGLIMMFVAYNLMTNIWHREYLLRTKLTIINKEIERKIQERTKKLQKAFEEIQILRIRERARMVDAERKAKELEKARTALINVLVDIEKARAMAEKERDKTLAIIQNFADGLLVFDKEGKVSLINPQAESFFKIKREEIVGKHFWELAQLSSFKPITQVVGEKLSAVFRKGAQIREDLILEVTIVPLVRGEETVGTLMVLHDVTREKEIERMKTEFVSVAAHQLRTPLSAIKWTLKMFLEGDLGELTKEQREFLEKTYQSNERMINLINDLLNVARIEEGRYLYKPVLADIVSICQSVIDSYKKEIGQKKFKI
jgi:PAS domain S-box-containing protein